MTKHEIVRSLRKEIRKLNRAIDEKIIYGLPYHRESRRHRFLQSQLRNLVPERSGIFMRMIYGSI